MTIMTNGNNSYCIISTLKHICIQPQDMVVATAWSNLIRYSDMILNNTKAVEYTIMSKAVYGLYCYNNITSVQEFSQ